MTLPAALSTRIDKLHKSASNARNATNPSQKQAAEKFLVSRAGELRAERDALYHAETQTGTLVTQEQWLRSHETHPKHDAFEAQWRENLASYVAICDALDAALGTWLGDGEVVA